jgi:hypothetical protein
MKIIGWVFSTAVSIIFLYLIATFYLGGGLSPWDSGWPEAAGHKLTEIPEDGKNILEWFGGFFEKIFNAAKD